MPPRISVTLSSSTAVAMGLPTQAAGSRCANFESGAFGRLRPPLGRAAITVVSAATYSLSTLPEEDGYVDPAPRVRRKRNAIQSSTLAEPRALLDAITRASA